MLPANNMETPRATPIATPTKKRITVNIVSTLRQISTSRYSYHSSFDGSSLSKPFQRLPLRLTDHSEDDALDIEAPQLLACTEVSVGDGTRKISQR